MRINSKLVSMKIENGKTVYRLNLEHNNQKTTLDQDIVLTKNQYGHYVPDIKIESFEKDFKFDNAKDAMLKYADWLTRLGVALKIEANRGNFSSIKI